jgi:hypothetical protein
MPPAIYDCKMEIRDIEKKDYTATFFALILAPNGLLNLLYVLFLSGFLSTPYLQALPGENPHIALMVPYPYLYILIPFIIILIGYII